MENTVVTDFKKLTEGEKQQLLFRRQKGTLDAFLERHAITQAQYDKSLGALIEKMGITDGRSAEQL